MGKKAKSIGIRKATVFLLVAFVLLCFALLAVVFSPNIRHYYLTHIKYNANAGITKKLKDSELFADFESGKSICFLGDSITEGTVTGGIPWYLPVLPYIKGDVSNFSHTRWMVKDLIDRESNIPVSDIYVVAIGINDILLPYDERTSSSASEYVKRLERLARIIKDKSPKAKIYFVTPWPFYNWGSLCDERSIQFHDAIIDWCSNTEYICIDSLPIITTIINLEGRNKYMCDTLHPNSTNGVELYCYAVLQAEHDRKVMVDRKLK